MWFDRDMVRATALDHLVLVVADVERTMAWYREHLGLEPVRLVEWRAGEVPFPSLRVTADTIIDVVSGHDGARGHLDHVCFVVSAAELTSFREQSGLAIEDEGERFGARGMASSVYVRDPDGLLVELRAYPDG
jgi:catechol 2,3-dioxygenase-like lactoylglutathione lyase family enzyme